MFHNPPRLHLYSPYKIEATFLDDLGKEKSGWGTGFFIDASGGVAALVTNRHMIDLSFKSNEYKNYSLHRLSLTGRTVNDKIYKFSIDATHRSEQTFIGFSENPIEDVAVYFQPWIIGLDNLPNKRVQLHFGIEYLADEDFFQTHLEPFDMVAFAGFPEEHDRLADRPLMRGGHISSDPKFDFSLFGKAAGRCIAYESYSSSGASGSPVFALARGLAEIPNSRASRLIGVNAGHLKGYSSQHIGLSYFYKSTVILDVLKSHGFGSP